MDVGTQRFFLQYIGANKQFDNEYAATILTTFWYPVSSKMFNIIATYKTILRWVYSFSKSRTVMNMRL